MKYDLTLLYIEDEPITLEIYVEFFSKRFSRVITASDGNEGLLKYDSEKPDLVITDFQMPDMNGPEFIHTIRKIDKTTPIVILSAHANEDFLLDSIQDLVDGYLTKPASTEQLEKVINQVIHTKYARDVVTINEKKKKPNQNSQQPVNTSPPPSNVNNAQIAPEKELIVVGIGSSAGGLEALTSFVNGLPLSNNTAYIVAQHLSPKHNSMMVDLISRETTLTIISAKHKATLEPDTVYITPPNKNVEINADNQIILSEPDENTILPKPSVNQLFRSIAEHKKEKAVGIILSGTGSDGAHGMLAINAEGGITIVQDPSDAKYDGMPISAINGCNIDMVIVASEMGAELVALANFPRHKALQKHQEMPVNDNLKGLFDLLIRYKKVDFSVYKTATISRRIERRMLALKIEQLSDYVAFAKSNENEVELLYKDILIGVTSFFRDHDAYLSFETKLYQYLDRTPDLSTLRLWMPGCSTGEEAYSIAMTILEVLSERKQSLHVKIFATDINETSIEFARKGVYKQNLMAGISETLINRYFNIEGDNFIVKSTLREKIVFSYHNILTDPPFKHLDVIICRNMLIYINNEAQKSIMSDFHFALRAKGLLFLGKSENATNFEHFFNPIDKKYKIFQSVAASTKHYRALNQPLPRSTLPTQTFKLEIDDSLSLQDQIPIQASKILLPNVIVTNEHLEVVYKKGDLDFIKIPEGYVSFNLYKIVDVRLIVSLKRLIENMSSEEKYFSTNFVFLPHENDDLRYVKVFLVPIISKKSRFFVFYFQTLSGSELPQLRNLEVGDIESASNNANIKMLETELYRTKKQMQTLVEELETTNEELQSTNEELQSSNEELQATNEEMETSNEELQSTNEELQTAYSELIEIYTDNADIKNNLKMLNVRYESVLQNINDGAVVTNADGIVLRSNPAMQRFMGISREGLLAKNWRDIVLSKSPDTALERQKLLLKNGTYGPYVLEFNNQSDVCTIVKIMDYVNIDQDGNVQIWSFATDISKERNMVSELSLKEERYRGTFELANVGLAHVGLDGKLITCNQSFCNLLGYTNLKLKNMSVTKITLADDIYLDAEESAQLINGERKSYKVEKRFVKKGGQHIWVVLSVSIFTERDHTPYFIYVVEDIDSQKNLSLANAQAQIVFNTTQEAIIVTDEKLHIIDVNPAFTAITGFTKKEAVQQNLSWIYADSSIRAVHDAMLVSLKKTGLWSGEITNKSKDGNVYPAVININAVRSAPDDINQYICVLTDVSIIKQSQERVEYLATHDTLTGLANRTLFNDRMQHAIEHARRSKSYLAVLFIDLDRFKVINDGLGHHVGDLVLIEAAKRFQNVIRAEDTIARIGGDEFAMVLEELDSPLGAAKVIQKIIDSISQSMQIEKHKLQIGCSVGVSVYPIDGNSPNELIRQADIAMYDAKKNGRNTFRYTSKELASNAFEKANLETAVREGLEKDEFEVYYQPIISLETKKTTHFEALIRWNHSNLGLVMPNKFIPMAEESELIINITKYMLFAVMKHIHAMAALNCDIKVAVNFSSKDLESDLIFSLFKQYMQKFNIKGSSIGIEITERKLFADGVHNANLLNRYRNLGVIFSMDDFGTGYSNLSYLVEKPFNILKIDRAFISKIGDDNRAEELVKATISIAQALGLETVAEGVETKKQCVFLRKHGCDYVQGYFIQEPRPVKLIEHELDSTTLLSLK